MLAKQEVAEGALLLQVCVRRAIASSQHRDTALAEQQTSTAAPRAHCAIQLVVDPARMEQHVCHSGILTWGLRGGVAGGHR
jgi:hypothetical protein